MTNLEDRKKAVLGLTDDPDAFSVAGQIRAALNEIDAAMLAGVKQEKILEKLGLKMSLPNFRRTLYRIRKEAGRKQGSVTTPTPVSAKTAAPQPNAVAESPMDRLKKNRQTIPGADPDLDTYFDEK